MNYSALVLCNLLIEVMLRRFRTGKFIAMDNRNNVIACFSKCFELLTNVFILLTLLQYFMVYGKVFILYRSFYIGNFFNII